MTIPAQLSTYRTNQLVEAAKIETIPTIVAGANKYAIKLEGFTHTFPVSGDWLSASGAQVGGYLIRYGDGTLGYCPEAAFLEGYEIVEAFSEPVLSVEVDVPLVDEPVVPLIGDVLVPTAPTEAELQEQAENQRRAEYGYAGTEVKADGTTLISDLPPVT